MLDTTMSERLRTCRDRTGLTVREVAKRAGLSPGHVSNGENNSESLSLTSLSKLESVYRTTVAWLKNANPNVDCWREFQESTQASIANGATSNAANRASALLSFLNDRYSGHLQFSDVARHMGLTPETIDDIRVGKEPTDLFLRFLAQLCGGPFTWLQMGRIDLLDIMPGGGLSLYELRSLVEMSIQAKSHGITVDAIRSMVDVMSKVKGGG